MAPHHAVADLDPRISDMTRGTALALALLTALPAALRGPVAELRHLRRVATVPVASTSSTMP